ncbi:MAG: DUF87 domain-containing protein [Alcaligenaceae bacterium]|nr:DUF87 domain-containing protein [Alcaligenaceae bacterium]
MNTYEKLGSFYLGSELSTEDNKDLVLYDAKDLTTHAVIIGMTGSGKTGLGVCLLEEALLDGIPVIAVDPKGDLGNLLLTFDDLSPEKFKPYIDPSEASQKGLSVDELAKQKASLWEKGLEGTYQSKARIKALRQAVDMNLYTPGASYGRPISLLKSLTAPKSIVREDKDIYREKIASSTTAILALMQLDADSLSRPYILISQILMHYWDKGQDVSIADLIGVIQKPPFERIGVMDLEQIYPNKERFKLAMQLNNVLASPDFEAWVTGEALDTERFLFNESGKPQLSVMNIAHLSESERLFFVTMLLNDILAWMRTQSGTSSLRAILYIDEIFGYMPPISNPATKPLLLTLLKQARAYGLGLVLSTQNPVDLDYKGLSNTGTWFIGKLQTQQDRDKVIGGLLSATEEGFDRDELEEAFNQLGKRKFLMHNVHDSHPILMHSRWAMSFLSGPLSRQHIQQLCATQIPSPVSSIPSKDHKDDLSSSHTERSEKGEYLGYSPLPPELKQFYLPTERVVTDTSKIVYKACLMGIVNIHHENRPANLNTQSTKAWTCDFSEGAIAVDWDLSQPLYPNHSERIEQIGYTPLEHAYYHHPISVVSDVNLYRSWEKSLKSWIQQNDTLHLFYSPELKLYSTPEETQSQFIQRISQQLREKRDEALAELKQSLEKKLDALDIKRQKAHIKLEKEQSQASGKTMQFVIDAGTSILSAFFGRKRVSVTNARRLGRSIGKAKGVMSERKDIAVAKQQIQLIEDDIALITQEFEEKRTQIIHQFEPSQMKVETVDVYPKSTGIQVIQFGVAWQPGMIKGDQWLKL